MQLFLLDTQVLSLCHGSCLVFSALQAVVEIKVAKLGLVPVYNLENSNLRAALSTSDVIELPTPEELKTVVDKGEELTRKAISRTRCVAETMCSLCS
ncbi:hypothetical protein Taro_022041 [Colocasia esculenta]|uniref:Uncharacterized protein n=1 Tax=Colocasia esculenta TaxID=4460 RepID=A0A843VDA1_COLES|nr:hypothetical protein [Colocasia esculenta]